MDANDPNKYRESASDRAHGTHGRGRTEERRLDEPVVDPGTESGLSEPAWGSEGSGGSAIDKRRPKKK
jgi:hypothetical protein